MNTSYFHECKWNSVTWKLFTTQVSLQVSHFNKGAVLTFPLFINVNSDSMSKSLHIYVLCYLQFTDNQETEITMYVSNL
jgi:hypothetical protein